jgi:hypothetical protein
MISRARLLRAGTAALGLALAPAAASAQIETRTLSQLDPLEVGLSGGALGSDVWAGSNAQMISGLLGYLPDAYGPGYEDEATARFATAILLSGGRPPRRGRGDGALALARADRLMAAAGPEAVYELLSRTPGLNQNAPLATLFAEAAFSIGAGDEACRLSESLIDGRDTAYWLRVRAFCQVRAGQGAAAEINADIARGLEPDPHYDSLLFALLLDEAPPDDVVLDNGLDLAMMVDGSEIPFPWAGGEIPFPLADGEIPFPYAEGEIPFPFAETAPGWLTRQAETLTHATATASQDPAVDLAAAEAATGQERRLGLEAVLAQGIDREYAARALHFLLRDAAEAGEFADAARRYGGEVQMVPVTDLTVGYGVEFVLAAVMAGDARSAMIWRDGLMQGPPRRPVIAPPTPGSAPNDGAPLGFDTPKPSMPVMEEAQPEWMPPEPRIMVLLDLIIALAQDDIQGDGMDALIAAWFEAEQAEGMTEMAVMTALGAPAPEGWRPIWLDMLFTEMMPEEPAEDADATAEEPEAEAPAAVRPPRVDTTLAAMDAALRADAKGEAALLAVMSLHNGGASISTDQRVRALTGLAEAGLREEVLLLLMERLARRLV